jgi:hypothetical protein
MVFLGVVADGAAGVEATLGAALVERRTLLKKELACASISVIG